MSNEQKVCCGGFFIGDGLEMDGKTLKALGGGSDGQIYKVTGTFDYSTQTVTLSETHQQMYENIQNGKIPYIYLSDYDVFMLAEYDDYDMSFIQVYPQKTEPYFMYMKSIYVNSETGAQLMRSDCNYTFHCTFTNSSGTWKCAETFSEVNSICGKYGVGGEMLGYYTISNIKYYARPVKIGSNYIIFASNYPTDTGIHFDYFKFNQDETVEYTSKDITI